MAQSQNQLPQGAFILGLAGLLPQLAACIVAFTSDEYKIYALVSGFAYSALILSFIGGVWWGQALSAPTKHTWIFIAAVCPSLIAWGAALLLFFNLKSWPYVLGAVAAALLVSPLIDVELSKVIHPLIGWMKLRIMLSIGLGCLTLLLATLALNAI
jgi:Protein of unknown function (DUF3429)